ncbi:16S rRNA (uracil(1498)-N(3))-methyltransferase [Pararhodobacter zhoushanensis]|uniref:Ribosomal RNA small subunit methyltransferase E n=1 Tax=Pararhodobacter zhoushanensis TaxID=2479545 RepID=A0ABT3H3K6_9RHOB|nr:16S rRNA (uracil(1498)-N(3))-methyltransferase [Pararhodobacter zhoushanensis]MCW1934386.1 16S rRNA (uracil(1498)-N(3))-methyltransferase [Pararhodobacter zhoushanensis]
MPTIPPRNDDRPKVRLYVEQALAQGQHVAVTQDQSHYLGNVLRLAAGADVALFNGKDGEWRARIGHLAKRGGALTCEEQTAPQTNPPDLWLLFAPIKKARTDFIVEKAVEMGAARILPVQTEFTNSERIRRDRLQAHAVEAAEQSAGTFVPEVADLTRLDRLLADWPTDRVLWWADESLKGCDIADPAPAPAAILIGPEGGFSPAERLRLRALPFIRRLSLGPRILRADTAAVAALTLWQVRHGDWTGPR